jgi:hypothetical protein
LSSVKSRYDDLQKAFRGCHTTLKELTKSLSLVPQSDTVGLVRITVQRLDDFNEDTRVELEIRSADEERVTQAFQTLLRVKGAITSEEEMVDLEEKVTAFVEGTDKSVSRAMRQFSQKLDDLTHDIASIKAFIHDLPDDVPEPPKILGRWSTFTASLLGQRPPSRPVSPAPTFGSVMTTPRLRHAPSLPQLRRSPTLELSDPLAGLQSPHTNTRTITHTIIASHRQTSIPTATNRIWDAYARLRAQRWSVEFSKRESEVLVGHAPVSDKTAGRRTTYIGRYRITYIIARPRYLKVAYSKVYDRVLDTELQGTWIATSFSTEIYLSIDPPQLNQPTMSTEKIEPDYDAVPFPSNSSRSRPSLHDMYQNFQRGPVPRPILFSIRRFTTDPTGSSRGARRAASPHTLATPRYPLFTRVILDLNSTEQG